MADHRLKITLLSITAVTHPIGTVAISNQPIYTGWP